MLVVNHVCELFLGSGLQAFHGTGPHVCVYVYITNIYIYIKKESVRIYIYNRYTSIFLYICMRVYVAHVPFALV